MQLNSLLPSWEDLQSNFSPGFEGLLLPRICPPHVTDLPFRVVHLVGQVNADRRKETAITDP
jgi:hypothetical protein